MDKILYVIGGTAWINLVNTTYNSNKQKIDILANTSNTFQWLEENNLLRESDALALENEELLDSLIVELHSLRHLSETILSDLEQKGKLSLNTTDQFKRLVKKVEVNLTIDTKNEKFKLVSEGITARDHVLYNIVDSIIHTLDSISINRIRKCEHQECSLYFVDTSKSGKRRWCSMELCGNRKKAAEFYARKKKK
ncbi:putative RNA-binding Zn ribbon-like protein [Salibacterium salarium]|uniref:CGNR zinc finger domain-containing protein n=1 Tax=Salibacterium salarium TaxID=284579 RepID=UPI0027846514|nr:CGNR zinc finger domain-containing protein [Salibacterium salarium]MDQ0300408.1 putative RNA-binding Zn ribbon-like protein [Salibacterium salarium]